MVKRIVRHAPVLRLLVPVGVALAPPLAAQRPDSARATRTAPVTSAADTARADTARADTGRARAAPYRDPRRARVLGTVLPGAGHVYAGEYFRGYLIAATTFGGLTLGPLSYRFFKDVNSLDECGTRPALVCRTGGRSWTGPALGVLATAAGAAMWVFSAVDAPRAAERANARRQRRRATLLLTPPAGRGGGAALGVAVPWR